MRTVNKVILIGNVTRDPSIKTTESGKKVAMFTIATNRYFNRITSYNVCYTKLLRYKHISPNIFI